MRTGTWPANHAGSDLSMTSGEAAMHNGVGLGSRSGYVLAVGSVVNSPTRRRHLVVQAATVQRPSGLVCARARCAVPTCVFCSSQGSVRRAVSRRVEAG